MNTPNTPDLASENAELRAWLAEAEDTLRAIGAGEVDARVMNEEVYALKGAEKALRQAHDSLDQRVRERTAELQQQREWLKVTLASIGDALIATDAAGRITFLNPVAETLTGWSRQEALGQPVQSVFRIVDEATRSPREDLVERALREGATVKLANNTCLIARAEHEIPIEDSAAPIKDRDGKVAGAVLVFHDVTEKRRAQHALRESEAQRKVAEAVQVERQRLTGVLNLLPAYVVLLSPDYRVPFANRFFEERFGKSEGRRCYEYLFQRTEPCENCQTYKVLQTNAPQRWEWTGPDGRNYDIYDFPFTDVDGSPLIMEVGLDITERKQAEAAVQAERRRLFEVLETLPAMVCLLTPDYHVAFANRSFRQKFGEANGRHCYEYCFGRNAPCDFCESYNVLQTGQPHHWEVKGPDGTVMDAYDFPFTDVDGTPMILEMDLDITERRQAEAELARHRQHLQEMVEERTKELRATNEELTRFNEAMVGRELRMIELKQEINALCAQLGLPPRYGPVLGEEAEPAQ
jgi:PAS domain S-box-containing protein